MRRQEFIKKWTRTDENKMREEMKGTVGEKQLVKLRKGMVNGKGMI